MKEIEIEGKPYILSLWNLAGQDRFRFMHTAYIRGAKGAIFFFDLTRGTALDVIEEWVGIART